MSPNAPEQISMQVGSWSTNEPQPDGWRLNLADQAVTCTVGRVVFGYGVEEGLRQYTEAALTAAHARIAVLETAASALVDHDAFDREYLSVDLNAKLDALRAAIKGEAQ